MDIYIDKEHLKSYIKESSDSRFPKSNYALKEKFNIHFLFPKGELIPVDGESYEVHQTKLMVRQWIVSMTDGVGSSNILWKEKLPQKVQGSNDPLDGFTISQLSSVYWLNPQKLFNKDGDNRLIFANIGKELDSLSSLLIKNFTKQIEIKKMKSWDDIIPFISPCSDIILVDQYIFSSPEIYDFNIYSLLKTLSGLAHKCKLNVVVFTTPYSMVENSYGKKIRIDHDWKKIIKEIKSRVFEATEQEINVTFVLSSNIDEHDRLLFTNYKGFFSGDTYNYFNSKGDVISKGRFLDIYSLLEPDYLEHWTTFINDMQAKIYEVEKMNLDNVKGDKKCHFLKFSEIKKERGAIKQNIRKHLSNKKN